MSSGRGGAAPTIDSRVGPTLGIVVHIVQSRQDRPNLATKDALGKAALGKVGM